MVELNFGLKGVKHFLYLVSFNGVAEEEGAVDEAFAREENPDLGVAVMLKLSVDPKPEIFDFHFHLVSYTERPK